MNHCVTNYYRDGNDFIGHHSDKDLDLDKEGVIVSVSLGDERVLELKRRSKPHDVTRILLPHGSMLVLGPKTNRLFTHSILSTDGDAMPRVSLTFRRVLTFMDTRSGRLFGEGTDISTLAEVRKLCWIEDISFLFGYGGFLSVLLQMRSKRPPRTETELDWKVGIAVSGLTALAYFSFKKARFLQCKQKEEKDGRAFFSRTSVHGTKYL